MSEQCRHHYALKAVHPFVADGLTTYKEYELICEKCGRIIVVDEERYHTFVKLRIAGACREYREAD